MKPCIKKLLFLGIFLFPLAHLNADSSEYFSQYSDIKKIIIAQLMLVQKYGHYVIKEELGECLQLLESSDDCQVDNGQIIAKLTVVKNKIEQLCKAPRPDTDPTIVGPSIECDSKLALGLINQIISVLLQCCNALNQDFIYSFSFINDFINTITQCCTEVNVAFNEDFTMLAEIENTLTTCCAEGEFNPFFNFLSAEFNGTATTLFDLESTLTICCNDIQNNFNATFTVIASLNETVTCPPPSPCAPIQVSMPITITASGFYCLATDINGPIVINSDNVTFDLNSHTITGAIGDTGAGITINSGVNRLIRNGTIRNFNTGIECAQNINTILEYMSVIDSAVEGITIATSSAIILDSVMATSVSGIGFHFVGSNQQIVIKNSTVSLCQQGFIFDLSNSLVMENCQVLNCTSAIETSSTVGGIVANSGSFDLTFDNCSVKHYTGLAQIAGFCFTNCDVVLVRDCAAQNIVATGTNISTAAIGFSAIKGADVHFINSIASDISGYNAIGFAANS